MTAKQIHPLACFLIVSFASWAATTGGPVMTAAEYRAQLDHLLSATQQLDSSGRSTPRELRDLPASWNIHLERGDFDISTEGLRRDVHRYESDPSADKALAIRRRIQDLREHLAQYEKDPADVSAERSYLNSVLARPEFSQVRGPGWSDRLKASLLNFLLRALGRLFRTVAIPTVGRVFVYGLIVLAVLALAYLLYRNIVWGTDFEKVTPAELPVSAKEWAVWLAEARACAAQGDWRAAIHLAYWAGISFLERQGAWKPDGARTPREYLRLLSGTSEHRESLAALTRIFELAWYAKRDATEVTFSETLAALEKLGCR